LNEALGPHIFPPKEDGTDPRLCPTCNEGRLSLKVGKFGSFVGCSNYPTCRYTRPLASPEGGDQQAESGDRELGLDPAGGRVISLKIGRFGPYVERATDPDDPKEKPQRSSLPKGWTPASIDLAGALRLLSLPREVGRHPEDGEPILAGLGRYGPYVQHGKTYASVDSIDEAFEVGLNRAVTLIAEKRAGGARGRSGPTALKDLGAHPASGDPIRVLSGRFGPYVNAGKINANLPRGLDPQEVTLEQAVALLAEREAKGGGKKPARRAAAKPAPKAKAAPAKKPAAKKPAAKKAAPKKKPAKA
ncbi:MAG: topoisomerase C-terminal repeat-containing protein, partial [Caulobacteraceae bacterium]